MPNISKKSRPVLLCFVSYYLPGFRSGGPVRTIANFVEHFGDEFDIRIVTRDRDIMDSSPYQNIVVDNWNSVGKTKVFYASSQTLTLRGVSRLLNDTPHDILYLNSFFAWPCTGLPLLARRLGLMPKAPCVIAPRGEFSQGAIALKAWKKRIYLWLSRLFGLYDRLTWQASSEFEAKDIHREFGVDETEIVIAPNLPSKLSVGLKKQVALAEGRRDGPLRVVFLSRISPMKNLDFALRTLALVKHQVTFIIYGPDEDKSYWSTCQKLINQLPKNIVVKYEGKLKPDEVNCKLAEHDLFFLPTRGENYGHVILEALAAGLPVLISDRTPWQDLRDCGVGWSVPLDTHEIFAQLIDEVATWSKDKLSFVRKAAVAYALDRSGDNSVLVDTRNLFLSALHK